MKKANTFFEIEKRSNGDIFCIGFRVEKLGGKKFKIRTRFYDISDNLQNVSTVTTEKSLKKLENIDKVLTFL